MLNPFRREFTGRYAARSVYGAIVVLALLLALEDHSPGPFAAAGLVAGTVLAVLSAEAYSEILGAEVDHRRRLTRDERRAMEREHALMFAAAVWPVIFLLLAGVGLLEEETAYTLGTWVVIAMLFVFGYLARRLAGLSNSQAVVSALVLGSIGLLLAGLKAVLHG